MMLIQPLRQQRNDALSERFNALHTGYSETSSKSGVLA